MKLIRLNRRTARMLREQLVGAEQGYEYVELHVLDRIANKLRALMGDYADRVEALQLEDRHIRRALVRDQIPAAEAQRQLMRLEYDMEDANEAAEAVSVELRLEDGHHRLVKDKLAGQKAWRGAEDVRRHILALVEAVNEAETIDPEDRPLRLIESAADEPAPDGAGAARERRR